MADEPPPAEDAAEAEAPPAEDAAAAEAAAPEPAEEAVHPSSLCDPMTPCATGHRGARFRGARC